MYRKVSLMHQIFWQKICQITYKHMSQLYPTLFGYSSNWIVWNVENHEIEVDLPVYLGLCNFAY